MAAKHSNKVHLNVESLERREMPATLMAIQPAYQPAQTSSTTTPASSGNPFAAGYTISMGLHIQHNETLLRCRKRRAKS